MVGALTRHSSTPSSANGSEAEAPHSPRPSAASQNSPAQAGRPQLDLFVEARIQDRGLGDAILAAARTRVPVAGPNINGRAVSVDVTPGLPSNLEVSPEGTVRIHALRAMKNGDFIAGQGLANLEKSEGGDFRLSARVFLSSSSHSGAWHELGPWNVALPG